jgi:hypothetical protein
VPVRTATALALLAAVCGGCAADRAPDATATAQGFQTALSEDDGADACAHLSDSTASALEQDQGMPCPRAILELRLPASTKVDDAQVSAGSAAVRTPGGVLVLDEAEGGWKVSAAGCTPTAAGEPLECELEH